MSDEFFAELGILMDEAMVASIVEPSDVKIKRYLDLRDLFTIELDRRQRETAEKGIRS